MGRGVVQCSVRLNKVYEGKEVETTSGSSGDLHREPGQVSTDEAVSVGSTESQVSRHPETDGTRGLTREG